MTDEDEDSRKGRGVPPGKSSTAWDAKIDAQELYCFLTGMDKVQLFLKAEEEVDPEIEEKYMELIAKRAERIPLQHITGYRSLWDIRSRCRRTC